MLKRTAQPDTTVVARVEQINDLVGRVMKAAPEVEGEAQMTALGLWLARAVAHALAPRFDHDPQRLARLTVMRYGLELGYTANDANDLYDRATEQHAIIERTVPTDTLEIIQQAAQDVILYNSEVSVDRLTAAVNALSNTDMVEAHLSTVAGFPS